MAVTVQEFRAGLSEAQITLLDATIGDTDWTDETIVERFDNGLDWCDSNFVLSEFVKFANHQPSSGQEFLFHSWMGVFCDFAGVPASRVPADADWKQKRQARTKRYQAYCKTDEAIISWKQVVHALANRNGMSDAIKLLSNTGNAMGLDLPVRNNAAEEPDTEGDFS